MLNREKFEKEILDIVFDGGNVGLDEHNKLVDCRKMLCSHCQFCFLDGTCAKGRKKWFNSEYIEPEVDWSKVPIDTPVLVMNRKENIWCNRHFAYYQNGKFYVFANGATSWSSNNSTIPWELCKLAREEDKIIYSKN